MSEGLATDDSGDDFASGRIPYSRYHLIARIGKGGMAEVFRAVVNGPEGFERELVVKRILPRFSNNAQFVSMFVNEAKICALLSHPNIVQIYEFGQAEGTYFIAMESVHGVSLRDVMAKLRDEQRTMPFLLAADITRQICLGLDYAHTLTGPDGAPLEIIHRDISPPNIMLAFNGTAKVVDFGIARAAYFAEAENRQGIIKGKVSYLAPEQINRQPMDGRVDVFAAGVVMHEMLTGRRLFVTNNELTKMRQLLMQPTAPPSASNASIPRELDRIVLRALERDPARRYPSAAAMAADIERTLIAARHSSRELAKMLRALYHEPEETPIIIDEEQNTVIDSATKAPRAPTATTTPGTTQTQISDQPVTESFRGAGSAERTRLLRARWRTRLVTLAVLAVVGAAAMGGVRAWQRYVPGLWQRYAMPFIHPTTTATAAPAPVAEVAPAPIVTAPAAPVSVSIPSKPVTRPSRSGKRPAPRP
ncbi:MAG: eukaryotic-like serine/threonine-protein kinase [Myxococcales bacterium]|jgi:serine/threonine-protein kinase|nr:eukaryotic-like serine/threonine-protein kinase [Myxococcales bacterium]